VQHDVVEAGLPAGAAIERRGVLCAQRVSGKKLVTALVYPTMPVPSSIASTTPGMPGGMFFRKSQLVNSFCRKSAVITPLPASASTWKCDAGHTW
jgi:hypothetical protein